MITLGSVVRECMSKRLGSPVTIWKLWRYSQAFRRIVRSRWDLLVKKQPKGSLARADARYDLACEIDSLAQDLGYRPVPPVRFHAPETRRALARSLRLEQLEVLHARKQHAMMAQDYAGDLEYENAENDPRD